MRRSPLPVWRRLKAKKPSADALLQWFGTLQPPVDPFALAAAMQIQVLRFPNLPCAGALDSNNAAARIAVRAEDAPTRQRFTVAHEIGHLILHPIGTQFRDTTFVGDRREAQANGYAAALLVPLWMLEPPVHAWGPNVELLATMFQVSHQAMEYQLAHFYGANYGA